MIPLTWSRIASQIFSMSRTCSEVGPLGVSPASPMRARAFRLRPTATSCVTADRSASSSLSGSGASDRRCERTSVEMYDAAGMPRGRGPLAQQKAVIWNQAHGHACRARNRDRSFNVDRFGPRAGEHLFDKALEERGLRKSLADRRGREAFLEIRANPRGDMRAAIFHAADLNQTAGEKLVVMTTNFRGNSTAFWRSREISVDSCDSSAETVEQPARVRARGFESNSSRKAILQSRPICADTSVHRVIC